MMRNPRQLLVTLVNMLYYNVEKPSFDYHYFQLQTQNENH